MQFSGCTWACCSLSTSFFKLFIFRWDVIYQTCKKSEMSMVLFLLLYLNFKCVLLLNYTRARWIPKVLRRSICLIKTPNKQQNQPNIWPCNTQKNCGWTSSYSIIRVASRGKRYRESCRKRRLVSNVTSGFGMCVWGFPSGTSFACPSYKKRWEGMGIGGQEQDGWEGMGSSRRLRGSLESSPQWTMRAPAA